MKSKTALVIGGSGGIGFEIVKTLSKYEMKVFASCSSNKDSLNRKLKEEDVSNCETCMLDVTNEENVEREVSKILEKHKIDVLVYCVSPKIVNKGVNDLSWKDFQNQIDVQVKGLFSIIKALKPLIESKHKIKFIVVLTEYCIGKPPSMLSHYITAKYGLMGLMKSMASELVKKKATFNMVSPGMVETELLSNLPPKIIEMTAYNNPMGRIAKPSDVAKVVAFLASEDSDYLNGVNIPINGGNIML